MGMGGPVSFLQPAIHDAMELCNVKNKKRCLEKLLTLEPWWLERIKNADS
jgi:hypothetical protein